MKLRAATMDDLATMTEFWQERRTIQAQTDARLSIEPGEYEQWQRKMSRLITGEVAGRLIVAEGEAGICGFIAGEIGENDVGVIHDLILDAHTYHGGLGRELVSTLREWFSAHGLQQMIVCTPRYYAVEQAFWHSLGAEEWQSGYDSPAEYVWMVL